MLEDRIILKENDTFVVSDLSGDIPAGNDGGLGLYRSDTRFLSTYELRLNGCSPVLLNSGVDRAYVATFQLVNPADPAHDDIPRQSLSVRRTRFVHEGMHERIGIRNCNRHPVDVELELCFDADFLDVFEVRGYRPAPSVPAIRRDRRYDPIEERETGIVLGYLGQDGVRRRTEVVFDPMPQFRGGVATLALRLDVQDVFVLLVDVLPLLGEREPEPVFLFDQALASHERTYQLWTASCTHYETDRERLDSGLLWRNLEDLRALCDVRPAGLVPTAGLPWLAAPFGRDAIITSLQTLATNPELARGSLRYLAQHQGTRVDPEREEEPGKVFHELRSGELANLREIPHTPFYGTVDSTPLFVVLLTELLAWTGDVDLLVELLPNVVAALEWIDRYGDLDADGLVEYMHHSRLGVRNHGWRDHWDSLMNDDGVPATLPAALVEVQGYVYHAKAGMAHVYRRLGRGEEADRLEQEALTLRRRFDHLFWMPGERYYAQALDGDKRQVTAVCSNPGHGLWSGIIDQRRAADVVARLMSPELFSGWGIRTVSTRAVNYNPMSYHNGSVWPHDNSIIAAGMRRYGYHEQAEVVVRSVLEACMRFSNHRIPELFCGFSRDLRFHAGPGEYFISCSPQAWAAGSLFHFLQVLTGVQPDLLSGRLRIDPLETPLYRRLRVEHMRVGDGELDFTVECGEGVRVKVDRKPAAVKHLELPM